MKRCVTTIAWKNTDKTIFDIIPEVAAAGYDGVEIWWPHVESLPQDKLRSVKKLAADNNLAIPIISPYLGNYNLEMTNADEMLQRMKDAAPVAAALGVENLRAFAGWTCECSSVTASEEYWAYNIAGFQDMAALAKKNGLYIVVETHGKTLADSVDGCLRLIDAAGDRIRINLQIDDIVELSGLADAASVYRSLKDHVVHSHVNPMNISKEKKKQLAGMYSAMREEGFDGFVSLENCSGQGDPREVIEQGLALMKDLGI